jgi:hypothetical protein
MWECSELSLCECFQRETDRPSPFLEMNTEKQLHRNVLLAPIPGAAEKHWRQIVFAYSGLDLSLEKDKLPALSGAAKQMSKRRPGDEYLAGLWRKSILADLAWTFFCPNGRRPSVWRSPSWSWASLDGEVIYGKWDSEAQYYSSCVNASVTPSGSDPTGQVTSAYIVLSAPVVSVQVQEAPTLRRLGDTYMVDKYKLEAVGPGIVFHPDCSADFEDGTLTVGDHLLCLRLGKCDGKDFCLVLKQRGCDDKLPLYERVGHLQHNSEALEGRWFTLGQEKSLVKLV